MHLDITLSAGTMYLDTSTDTAHCTSIYCNIAIIEMRMRILQ